MTKACGTCSKDEIKKMNFRGEEVKKSEIRQSDYDVETYIPEFMKTIAMSSLDFIIKVTHNRCSLHLVSNFQNSSKHTKPSIENSTSLWSTQNQISSLYLIETTCILVMLLLLWVHTIRDDTTVIVFLEASSYSVHTV